MTSSRRVALQQATDQLRRRQANWFAGWWSGDSFLAQKLDAGDTVVVPRQIEKIAWMREIKDITQVISQVALTAGVLIAAGL